MAAEIAYSVIPTKDTNVRTMIYNGDKDLIFGDILVKRIAHENVGNARLAQAVATTKFALKRIGDGGTSLLNGAHDAVSASWCVPSIVFILKAIDYHTRSVPRVEHHGHGGHARLQPLPGPGVTRHPGEQGFNWLSSGKLEENLFSPIRHCTRTCYASSGVLRHAFGDAG